MRRSELSKLAVGALTVAALGVVVHLLDGWMQTNPLAGAIIGAVLVDLVGGRLGLTWDETKQAKGGALALTVLRGFAFGAGLALGIAVIASMLRWARITQGSPSLMGLGLGVASPLAIAARDEVLYRGVPLLVMRGRISDRWALPFCALLGAAPIVLRPGASVIGVVLAASTGAFFTVLWRVGRGAWLPWGAHAGWLFMAGAGIHGSLLDVWFKDGLLVPVARAHGNPAWLGALVFAMAAFAAAWWYARRSPGEAKEISGRRD
ncbi:MAG: hypothetical protein HY898_36945 [Deltaproteobacteria bacterium]|nr:hypothetical protein [Deltaproteobacteria bacterium]